MATAPPNEPHRHGNNRQRALDCWSFTAAACVGRRAASTQTDHRQCLAFGEDRRRCFDWPHEVRRVSRHFHTCLDRLAITGCWTPIFADQIWAPVDQSVGEQCSFRRPPPVDRGHAHAGARADVVHVGGVIAVLGEHSQSGVKDRGIAGSRERSSRPSVRWRSFDFDSVTGADLSAFNVSVDSLADRRVSFTSPRVVESARYARRAQARDRPSYFYGRCSAATRTSVRARRRSTES